MYYYTMIEGTKSTRILVKDTPLYVGKKILVRGWVQIRRDHGKLIFFNLRDRSGFLQVIVNAGVSQNTYDMARGIRPEYVIEIKGEVKSRPEKAIDKTSIAGGVELEAWEIIVLSEAEALPFDMGGKDLNLELPTLLDNRSLVLRFPKISSTFKIQETIAQSFRTTLKSEEFTEIFVPTLVPVATEGGAEVFPVNYYQKKAYLAQSPQLYKQIMVSIFERVFTIAHAYRAEPSVTTRHLSEYVSLDAEMGFINSWEELMDMVEKIVRNIFKDLMEKNKFELENIFKISLLNISKKIPRLKLKDAQEILMKRTKIDHRKESDLDPLDEKEMCMWALEETGSPFVFITHFPKSKRPFYTMPDPKDETSTLSFDLLGINEEWITGGQRINDYKMLIDNIQERGGKPSDFEIYLQAFRYGMPPEGGFAFGLERITKDILGLKNIRQASLFPRDMERVDERK